MSEIPKIDFRELKRTHLGFPSEWVYNNVKISYRTGLIKIFVDGKLVFETSKDQFDVGGYMEDEELKHVLRRHNLVLE